MDGENRVNCSITQEAGGSSRAIYTSIYVHICVYTSIYIPDQQTATQWNALQHTLQCPYRSMYTYTYICMDIYIQIEIILKQSHVQTPWTVLFRWRQKQKWKHDGWKKQVQLLKNQETLAEAELGNLKVVLCWNVMLQCVEAVCCSVSWIVAVCCSIWFWPPQGRFVCKYCVAVCCRVQQCAAAVCCSALQHITVSEFGPLNAVVCWDFVLQCVAAECCSVM